MLARLIKLQNIFNEMRTVEVNGVGLACFETGKGLETIFVHGIPTDYRVWDAQIEPFSEENRVMSPTLLINGANGTEIFRAINKQLAKSVPNSGLAMIPKSSHFPLFENAESFNAKVNEFLARN